MNLTPQTSSPNSAKPIPAPPQMRTHTPPHTGNRKCSISSPKPPESSTTGTANSSTSSGRTPSSPPEYRLETPFTPVRHIDIPLLRQELPAVFDAIVYLKATDAERLLSRRRLYESAVAAAGIDRVRPLEHVNLGNLAKALPADEFSRYIILTQKPLPARIVRSTEEA